VKKIAVSVLVLAAIVWASWLITVPASMLESMVEENLKRGEIHPDLVGFKKGLFLSFGSEALDVMKSGERVLSVEDLCGRLELLRSLKRMRAVIAFRGETGGGKLVGALWIKGKRYGLDLALEGAELEKLGLFEHTGLKGSGLLSAEAYMEDNTGDVRFSVTDVNLKPVDISGKPIPLNMFHTVRGALNIKGRVIEVKSVSFEGKGLYARASGTIGGGMMNMTLDLMPEAEADLVMSVVAGRYRVSKGHYRIPVRRKIGF
jgi:type II secretion system protein N